MTDHIERLREIISRVSGEKIREEANELLDKLDADLASAKRDERERCAKVCKSVLDSRLSTKPPLTSGFNAIHQCIEAISALGDDDA